MHAQQCVAHAPFPLFDGAVDKPPSIQKVLFSSMNVQQDSTYKYVQLADTLRARINTAASGSRLPSVRALMKRYSMSMQTVILALKQLEEESLIVRRHGSGIYVSDKRSIRYIVYHRTNYPSQNNDIKEFSLMKAVQAAGWFLTVRRHDNIEGGVMPEPKACAHIVNQDIAFSNTTVLDQILLQKVPVVFLGREPGEHEVDYVTGDDWKYLSLLVNHFKQLGHIHFAFLQNEPPFYEIVHRSQLLQEILKMQKLPPATIIDCQTKIGEHSAQKGYQALSDYLKSNRKSLPFTVLLTASEHAGLAALRAFHDNGVCVPQQCSVGTFGCKIENNWTIPSLTDSGAHADDWGKSIVKVLNARFGGDPAPSFGVHVPCYLTVRESSGPPIKSSRKKQG